MQTLRVWFAQIYYNFKPMSKAQRETQIPNYFQWNIKTVPTLAENVVFM